MVSTSCSLLHTAVDLVNETKLDKEIKSWLAFAAQKVLEVNVLAEALAGQKDEVYALVTKMIANKTLKHVSRISHVPFFFPAE